MRLNLKVAVFASGKSQRAIAAACSIPENRFSEIVRGWAEPREHERQAIAAVLGKPINELFEVTSEPRHTRGTGARRLERREPGRRWRRRGLEIERVEGAQS